MWPLFDTICTLPVVTYVREDSEIIDHTDCRILFLRNSARVSRGIARVLTWRQEMLTTNSEQYYGLYAYVTGANGTIQYCTTQKQELIGMLHTQNKKDFVILCSQISHILWSLNNEDVKHEKERLFRILLEYAFRSWLKVRRDVCATGKKFGFSHWCLTDWQWFPTQIDALRNFETPTVMQYAERKIEETGEDALSDMYSFLQRRFGDEFVSHAFQQAWTFATEMYNIRIQEVWQHLGPEFIFDKN